MDDQDLIRDLLALGQRSPSDAVHNLFDTARSGVSEFDASAASLADIGPDALARALTSGVVSRFLGGV